MTAAGREHPIPQSIFRAHRSSPEFQLQLSTASSWQKTSLQNVTFALHTDTTAARINDCTNKRQSLIATVDSSSQNGNSSYGWILYFPNGEAIAENHGPNQGQPSGPRALAWGLLSVTTFLNQLMEFLHLSNTTFPPVIILSKNTKHISYLLGRPTYPTLFCNATLANNWDILEQTHQLITEAQMDIHWKSVHVFRQIHLQQSPPPFNLDQSLADTREKAMSFLQIDTTQYMFSPFLPSSRCQVYSLTSTINHQYNENYREAATTPPLRQYLQEKNNWTIEQSDSIQWDWLRNAVRTYKGSSRNHLTKLIYNQLATPARKAKAGGQHWTDPTCPHCKLHQETFEHLLRCDDPDAITFRMQLPKSITSLCKKYRTPPEFQKFLLFAIDSWLGQQQIVPPPNSSDKIQTLIEMQNQIGWTNFTRGFLSREWNNCLTETINPEQPMRSNPSNFFPKLIGILWTAQTSFWTSYQERRHALPAKPDQDAEQLTEIKAEVSYLYSLRDQVPPTHHNTYFPANLQTFLQHSTHAQLKSYTLNYGPAIKTSIKQHKEKAIANTRTIFTYPGFQRTTGTQTADPSIATLVIANTITLAQTNAADIPAEPPLSPPPPPPNIEPIAPDDNRHVREIIDPQPIPPPNIPIRNVRQQIQQSLLATFQRRRNPRAITPPPPPPIGDNTPILIPQPFTAERHQTVGDYISQMTRHHPASQTSTTDTEEPNTPPVIATRASSHYKHSKWRPAAHVRESFSQFFHKR